MAGGLNPAPLQPDPVLTADDIIRAGACYDGTYKVAARFHKRIAAAMPASKIEALLSEEEKPHLLKAAKADGYGDGYGNGDGYGDGYGYGYGYGYGTGDGTGDGLRNGDGGVDV